MLCPPHPELFGSHFLDIDPGGRSAVIRCASDGHPLTAVSLNRRTADGLRQLADEIERAQGRLPLAAGGRS